MADAYLMNHHRGLTPKDVTLEIAPHFGFFIAVRRSIWSRICYINHTVLSKPLRILA